jgi:hypothetical protein
MQTLEYVDTFVPLQIDRIVDTCREYMANGYRLVQIHPKMQEDGNISLYYSYGKLNEMVNFKVENIVKSKTQIPSVTPLALNAFVFENEAHDLFGIQVVGNPLDFEGHFYALGEGVEAPMTIITPAQLAAREKKAKLAKAKAAKEAAARAKAEGAAPAAKPAEDMEAKLAGMDPEKAAKVRAAMEAKAAREAAKAEAEKAAAMEEKLAGMDPEKAAKVRAAMEAKAKREAEAAKKEGE